MTMKKGYTLIEAILALAILVILMMTAAPFLKTAHISWEKDKELSNILQNARMSLDRISYELKHTNEIVEIDASYVKFATYLEEIYLDDRNAGHSQIGTWSSGALQGGYGGDYLISNTSGSTSRWQFNIITEGEYDVYIWYTATSANSDAVGYAVYDDGINEANYSVNQQINGSRWYKLGTVNFTNSGLDYLQMTVPAANYAVADGVKLVYKGYDHKEFNFVKSDPTPLPYDESHKIFFRPASKTNAETYLLVDNIYRINEDKAGEIPIFQYFQMDGVTEAISAGDAALIRISFEIRAKDESVTPYRLQTSVYRNISPKERRLVINEINVQTPERTIGFDNFEGVINNMDNDNYGWATETATKDYGWLSMLENLDDGEADPPKGWHVGGVGTWVTEIDTTAPKPAENRVYSATGDDSDNHRSNRYFYESSANLKFEFQYRVVARGAQIVDALGGANICSTFGVYLRAENPTDDNDNIVFVQFLRKGATCAGGTAYIRVAKYEGGAWRAISGNIAINNDYDNSAWHSVKIHDLWGKIHIFLDGTRVSNVLGYCYNSTTSCANAANQTITSATLVPRHKAIFAWSETQVRFDDIKITSYDFKPIAYLTDFEGVYNDWFSWLPPGSPGACGWAIDIPTSGPGSAFSGTKVAATNPAGNYNQNCDEDWYKRAAIDMQPSDLRWSFPFVHFFSWQDYPTPQTADCVPAARGDSTSRYYVLEPNIFPLDTQGQVITSPLNNFQIPPSSYDAVCTNPLAFYNTRRMWTADHQGNWTEIAYPIPEQNINTDVRVALPFASDNTATVASGHYVDNPSIYPGGLWERIDTPTGPGTCFSTPFCWATVDNADYSHYQNIALETPTAITPAWTYEITLSWVQYRDFEGTTTFYDGGFVEYSIDNGKTWTQFTSEQLSVGYDMCVIGSEPGADPPDTCYNPGYSNELQGYEGWTYDDKSWTRVTATLIGVEFANKEIKFRFHFGSDGTVADRGWFIDDVRVTVIPQKTYDWIEIYNPTPHSVDVNNWRIYTESSYQDTSVQYDTISIDVANGGTSTVIGPYGYAIVTGQNTSVYDGTYFTIPPEGPSARRLTIDDDAFGTLGLRFKFGKIKLKDNLDRLIDEVDYNVVFYDDMEDYIGNFVDYWRYRYSVQDWGNPTHWATGTPTSGQGPQKDWTRASPGQGKVWFLCIDPNNTTCEDYVNSEETGLLLPALNFSNSTTQNPPFIEFYFWNNVTDAGRSDGMILEVSTQGGSDFVQDPPSPDPIQLPGSSLSPGYYNRTIRDDENVLNGLYTYSRDIKTWTRITGNLSTWAGQVINLRFIFGAGNATSLGGPFLDNIAVYYDWAGLDAQWDEITIILTNSLERVNWMGDSNFAGNWRASIAPYNSPPTIGTPNRKNSVSP